VSGARHDGCREASGQLGLLPRPASAARRPHRRGHLTHRYLIALGSNLLHRRYGRPRDVLAAALEELEAAGVRVAARGPVLLGDPVGPSLRRYANSAALLQTELAPPELLARLKATERAFGD